MCYFFWGGGGGGAIQQLWGGGGLLRDLGAVWLLIGGGGGGCLGASGLRARSIIGLTYTYSNLELGQVHPAPRRSGVFNNLSMKHIAGRIISSVTRQLDTGHLDTGQLDTRTF